MKTRLALVSSLLTLIIFATPALAQGGKPSPFPTPRHTLTQTSLRSCEARQDAIKTRMDSLVKLATNIEDKFDSIAKRVEDFYTNTVLPSGKSVSNYDALVANISAKKDVVTNDLTDAQTKVAAFSCTTDDPKGLLTQFRIDMQKVKTDLKSYRTTIKNLIVAVRPLAPSPEPEASESPEASPTPTPTAAPTATP